jgi:DNA-binding GntR family transcriptional regulator
MRLALEPVGARLTCERWSQAISDEVEDNLRALLRAKTLVDVTRLDVEFHRLILRASGNGRLLAAWEALASQFLLVITRLHRNVEERTRRVRESTHRCHAHLVAGLQGGNPAHAETLARDHATRWLVELEELGVLSESKE